MNPQDRSGAFIRWAVLVVSATVIAYQIALMRIWSIAQWHHFAYLIISIAMLGLGVGGTVLTLWRDRVAGHESRWFYRTLLALALSLPLCYSLAQQIPFETFHLVSQWKPWLWLLTLYVLLAWPFFLSSVCTTLAFMRSPHQVGRVYFMDLLGSGVGAAVVVFLLYVFPVEWLPYVLSLPVWTLAGIAAWSHGNRARIVFVLVLLVAGGWFAGRGVTPLAVSEYKALSYVLQFPDAQLVASTQSPLSRLDLVRASQIRETPGQLGGYPFREAGGLPEQAGLFFDAGAISVVNRFDGDFDRLHYLAYVTPALAYRVVTEPEVLVIGAGGGTDVLMALYHGARHVTAVEVDPRVFPLIQRELRAFSGGLYERADVRPVVAEGRGFLQAEGATYDVIHIALLDAFSAAASGVYALSESYLYTREAVERYVEHLSPNGVLAITRWLKTPPRDAIRMFATLVEAAERQGIAQPGNHLVFIRSWNAATLLLSRSPWSEEQLQAIRAFAHTRGFDIDWLPGLAPEEVNRYTVMESPLYYQAAQALLIPEEREAFYRDYLFNVRPATDHQPHFFQFFKWGTLGALVEEMGWEWVPFVEWGYLALLGVIVQGAFISVILILLPLLVLRRQEETRGARRRVVGYFMALGLGFMLLEIAFIQQFMLFLHYPVYAVAVVLAAFLVCSGAGSRFAGRWHGDRRRLLVAAVAGIGLLSLSYTVILPLCFTAWASWPDLARVVTSFVFIAPLAFCMGIPFPSGLQVVSDRYARMLPWAWGINGFASVLGASLATFTAIHLGFRWLVGIAVLTYVLAVPPYMGLTRNTEH